MKKWITIFLILIVAASAFIPCCALDNCQADQGGTSTDKSHNKPAEKGTCSPFFSCASCSGFTVIAKSIQVPAIPDVTIAHHEGYTSIALSTYTSSLIQPPRAFLS